MMSAPGVNLALGTAQFGLTYGVAGRGEPVPPREARQIFARAWESGIRVVDTAPSYGDIEERLGDLLDGRAFGVVSKIPALRPEVGAEEIASFVAEAVGTSRARLGERLSTMLFHRGADLLGPRGEIAWRAARAAIAGTDIQLGASCYSPAEVDAVRARFPIAVTQVPANVLDQRVAAAHGAHAIEIHLRSVFLQGLLLLEPGSAALRVPRASAALAAWESWRTEMGLSRIAGTLAVVKAIAGAMPAVRYCVLGIDRLSQLEEIVEAWQCTGPLSAPQLAVSDEHVIDPRRW